MEGRKYFALIMGACGLLALAAAPAMAVGWSDNFDTYPGGGLGGNDGWGGSSAGAIDVVSPPSFSSPNSVKITGGGPGVTITNDIPDQAALAGLITVGFKIQGSANQPGSTTWYVDFLDTGGASLGRYYGTGGSIRGRIGGGAVSGIANLSGPGIWDDAKIVIDTVANTSTFYLNGVMLPATNPLSHAPAGDLVGSIQISRINNPGIPDYVYIDNLYVTPEPATLLLLGVGSLLLARRRAA